MAHAEGYSKTQIWLHWLVVLLIIPQFLLHDAMAHTFWGQVRGRAVSADAMTYAHIVLGVAILLLAAWRQALRATRGVPAPKHDDPPLMRMAAQAIHWLLYLVLFLLPISGGLAYAFTLGWMAQIHSALTTGLLVLAGLHVAGALYHQYVLKDHLLRRMMRPAG